MSSGVESGRVRIRRGDGEVIVCDYNATANFVPGRHLSILRDVTSLTRAGYDVDAHESPSGALEAITRKAPSLVLSDIVMPDLDGFELAERIRGLDADIPVLFISGYVDADRLAEISSGGQTIDMVAKPFTSVELLKRVAAALRRD